MVDREKLMQELGAAKKKADAGSADIDVQKSAISKEESQGHDQAKARKRLDECEIQQDADIDVVDHILDELDKEPI